MKNSVYVIMMGESLPSGLEPQVIGVTPTLVEAKKMLEEAALKLVTPYAHILRLKMGRRYECYNLTYKIIDYPFDTPKKQKPKRKKKNADRKSARPKKS